MRGINLHFYNDLSGKIIILLRRVNKLEETSALPYLSLLVFLLPMQQILTTIKEWLRFSRVVRASDCQCRSRNSPGLDPSILGNSGI
jgi:hypothetical protein